MTFLRSAAGEAIVAALFVAFGMLVFDLLSGDNIVTVRPLIAGAMIGIWTYAWRWYWTRS